MDEKEDNFFMENIFLKIKKLSIFTKLVEIGTLLTFVVSTIDFAQKIQNYGIKGDPSIIDRVFGGLTILSMVLMPVVMFINFIGIFVSLITFKEKNSSFEFWIYLFGFLLSLLSLRMLRVFFSGPWA
jgi:hypothetical protein